MNENSSSHLMRMIVCPACKKQITEQASVEIPTSDMQITPSVRFDRSDAIAGSSPGSLYYREGKYYLVLETMCSCPYCHTMFELDIPLEFAEVEKE